MIWKLLSKKTNNKGFTLTELIIVVAIIGILTSLAVPAVMGYLADSKLAVDEANRVTISNSIKRLMAKGTITPASVDAAGIRTALKADLGVTVVPVTRTTSASWVYDLTWGAGNAPVVSISNPASGINLNQ